jgi:hypothetical protein
MCTPGPSAPFLFPAPRIFSSFSWLDIAILVGESSSRNAIAPLSRSSHCLEIRGRCDRRRYTFQPAPPSPSLFFTIPRSFLLVPRASPASAEPLPFLVRATYAYAPPPVFPLYAICSLRSWNAARVSLGHRSLLLSSASLAPQPQSSEEID